MVYCTHTRTAQSHLCIQTPLYIFISHSISYAHIPTRSMYHHTPTPSDIFKKHTHTPIIHASVRTHTHTQIIHACVHTHTLIMLDVDKQHTYTHTQAWSLEPEWRGRHSTKQNLWYTYTIYYHKGIHSHDTNCISHSLVHLYSSMNYTMVHTHGSTTPHFVYYNCSIIIMLS